ncbi:SDR family oxidoreductase [Variovorax sp. J22R133]|uniref:SDR family NAD(P)-dependent oxidoreductase n=1 Tax=Variovorax brevis TaxID=3053503 RepID=UPI002575FDE1|nr:SDR family oxidoreductase [Variovorax sp. J22R133]MDM0116115.1 SDR family oxidoreductase [Variovorax sp. J22R133]
MRLKDKIAIVTGTSSGIGSAVAALFVEEGAYVLGVARRASEGPAASERFHALELDLGVPGAAEQVVKACVDRFGAPDILINNAGRGNAKALLDTTDEDLLAYCQVNLFAPFALCRSAIPLMRKRGGSIVNISSSYGIVGAAKSSAYVPTKAAIIGMTRNMATEFGRDGIRVNAVAPGLINTPLVQERLKSDAWFRKMQLETNPMQRPGEAIEIAKVCLFLASDDASFVNGVVLPVDGGWTMAKSLPEPMSN